jgi:hypothetical protein
MVEKIIDILMKSICDVELYQKTTGLYDCGYDVSETKKNCVIFSNCHGLVVSELLRNLKEFSEIYNIYLILPYLYTKDEYECPLNQMSKSNITNLLTNCDLFIYQKCYKNHDFLSTYKENNLSLQTLCKTACKHIILTNPQNTGLWSLHFNFPTDDEVILINFNDSLAKFKQKDEDSDTPIYNFFVENYRKKKLFIDRAHPTITIFNEVVKLIMNILEIKYDHIFDESNINPCNLLGGFPHTLQDVRIHQLEYVTLEEINLASKIK